MSRSHVDVIVLAGGRSRRMQGEDKLAAEVGRTSILARVVVAAATAPFTQNVVVAAGQDAASLALRSRQLEHLSAELRAGVQLVVDDPSQDGPVAGLAAALGKVTSPTVVVVAGDMPFITADVIDQLSRVLDDTHADEAWLAMAVDAERQQQFACCAWRRDPLIGLLNAERSSGSCGRGIALKALVKPVEARGLVRLVELKDATALLDVDDPVDLQQARALDARRRQG